MSFMDLLEDGWEAIVDGLGSVFSFEWLGDVGEFFSSMFEDIGEFSFLGLTFAVIAVGVSYGTRYLNLNGSGMGTIESMTQFMPPTERIVWTILSYVAAGVAGYFLGKHFENT